MKEIYDEAIKLFKELEHKNECAMVICHSMGYNGLKRWHRRRSKIAHCYAIDLANELFDNHRKQANVAFMPNLYTSTSLKEHLAQWDGCLETAITSLGRLSKQFLEKTGFMNACFEKAACKLLKDREKVRRWFNRFEETNWSAHDIHYVDVMLHEKEKKKEGHAKKNKNPY